MGTDSFRFCKSYMYNKDPFRFWHLFWRCLVPSASSLLSGSLIASLVIIGHLFYLCVAYEAVFPYLSSTFSMEWPPETIAFLRPIRTLVHSHVFDLTVSAAVWFLAGLLLYASATYVVRLLRALRTGDQIYVPSENTVVYNPLRHALLVRLGWRLAILVLTALVTAGFASILSFVWRWDGNMYRSTNLVEFLRYGAFSYLILLGVFHVYIFLTRLFLFRTRILGEILK